MRKFFSEKRNHGWAQNAMTGNATSEFRMFMTAASNIGLQTISQHTFIFHVYFQLHVNDI